MVVGAFCNRAASLMTFSGGNSLSPKLMKSQLLNSRARSSFSDVFRGLTTTAYFGVFDGHGGVKAAEFAVENWQKNIIDEIEKKEDGEIEEAVKEVSFFFYPCNLLSSSTADRTKWRRAGLARV